MQAEIDVEAPPVFTGIRRLVLGPARVSDGERLEIGAGLATRHGGYQRRVHTARQKDAERHVRDALPAHGAVEHLAEGFQAGGAREVGLHFPRQTPPFAVLHGLTGNQAQEMSRLELPCIGEQSKGRRYVLKAKEEGQDVFPNGPRVSPGRLEQHIELGAEGKAGPAGL